MRAFFIAATLLGATAMPSAVIAQQSCEQYRSNRTVGTVAGAGIGGVLGNVIAGSGDKTLGTIIGAVGGGVLGNQVTKNKGNCANAYGYYDKSGDWQANNVAANQQSGYYDRDNNWVEGAPQGYYDSQNRWVAAQGNNGQLGYRDRDGRWIAPSAAEFDSNGRAIASNGNGHWQNGRWVNATNNADDRGHYDRNGRWVANDSGYVDNGTLPGYYDRRGRWVPGTVRGRYDDRGVFIADNGNGYDNRGGNGYSNAGYQGGQRDIASRLDRIEARIGRGVQQGKLNRTDAQRAEGELDSIRRYDRSLRSRSGAISNRNESLVQARLDRLSDRLKGIRENG